MEEANIEEPENKKKYANEKCRQKMYPISLPNFEKLQTFNLVCSVKKLWELANSLACYTEIKYFTNCREMSLYFLFIVHGNEIQEKNQYRTVSCKLNGKLLFKNKNLFFFLFRRTPHSGQHTWMQPFIFKKTPSTVVMQRNIPIYIKPECQYTLKVESFIV